MLAKNFENRRLPLEFLVHSLPKARRGEQVPIVEIKILEGRDVEAKSRLIEEVTDAVERSIDVPREAIRVLIHEIPLTNWGTAGVTRARASE